MSLVFLLQRHRYHVTVASNGQAALDIMGAANPPHIALLEWEMPNMDGIQVCRTVRATSRRHYTYIVMLTVRDQAEDALAAFDAGVDDFLSKPVRCAELIARLRSGERVLEMEERAAQRIADLEKSRDEVRRLKRLLPLCMYCKKVRNDADHWQEIESYLHEKDGTDFSQGVCPDCTEGANNHDTPGAPEASTGRRCEGAFALTTRGG